MLAPDMRRLANNTTVGVASFREMVQNVQDVSVKWKPGRKKTVSDVSKHQHLLRVLMQRSTEQGSQDGRTKIRARRICRKGCK